MLPSEHDGSINSCITNTITEDYITQVVRKVGAKKLENRAVIDQCAAQSQNTTFLRNTKVMFRPPKYTTQVQLLDVGIIYAFKYYGKQLIWKTVAMLDGGLLQDTLCTKQDNIVSCAFHSRGLEADNSACSQQLFCQMWSSRWYALQKWWQHTNTHKEFECHSSQPNRVKFRTTGYILCNKQYNVKPWML